MVVLQAWTARLPAMTEIVLVVLAAWLVAGWLLPSPNTDDSRSAFTEQEEAAPDMELLLNTPLFGEAGKSVSAPAARPKPVTVSRLRIKLVGTVVAGDKSAAVVVMRGGKEQQLFFVGESMQPGVVLQQVEAGAIVVDHGGKLERIEIQQSKKNIGAFMPSKQVASLPQPRPGMSRKVSRSMLDSQLRNFPQLLSQARVVPHFENGKPDGFLISEIVSGSLYDKIGLQNGDLIRKVNGVEITGPQQAMAMFQKLQEATSIDVEIQRAGNVQQVHYDIQ